MLSMCLMA